MFSPRSLTAAAAALTLFLAGGASAQLARDGGWTAASTGFELGPITGTVPKKPLYIDAQGRALVLVINPNFTVGDYECWNPATGQKVNTLNSPAYQPYNFYSFQLGVGPSRNDVIMAAWGGPSGYAAVQFFRGSCGGTAQSLGSLPTPNDSVRPWGMANGHWPLLSNGDLIYPRGDSSLMRLSFAGASPAASVFVSPATLDAVLTPTQPPGGINPGVHRFLSMTVLQDDHIWAVVENSPSTTQRNFWLLEIAPNGTVAVRFGPNPNIPGATNLLYDARLDAFIFDVYGSAQPDAQAIIPRSPTAGFQGGAAPFFIVSNFNLPWPHKWQGLVSSAAGTPMAWTEQNDVHNLRPYRLDRGLADFDRDGLRGTEEDALGTSDFLSDSDGDGVTDGLERRLYGTGPSDAGSVPTVSTAGSDILLAPTLLPTSWNIAGTECRQPAGLSGWGAMCFDRACNATPSDWTCIDTTGKQLNATPMYSFGTPRVTPDLAFAWRRDSSTNTWLKRELATGMENPSAAITAVNIRDLVPLSRDVVVALEGTVGASPLRLWRYSGGNRFAVIDTARLDCPILGSVNDLPRCGAPELPYPSITDFRVHGFDPIRKLALVVVNTDRGRFLLGVGETDAFYLTDLVGTAENLGVGLMMRLPEGGYVMHQATTGFHGARRLDEAFRPIPYPANDQRALDADWGRFGAFFKNGYLGTEYESYLLERGTTAGYVPFAYATEWVPITQALEKGEVLFWSSGKYRGHASVGFRERDGSRVNIDEFTKPAWRLWRLNPVGAVNEWLEEPDFLAKLDAAGRASVQQRALGAITAMGASPDSLRVCLAEPAAGRVWELALDATTRKLATITLRTPSGGVSACAYDDQNNLAVLSAPPVVLNVGGSAVPVPGMGAPVQLMRFPGRWVVVADGETARCVGDDGGVFDTGVRATAASPAPGGLAYLDPAGTGFLTSVNAFCTGAAPEEQLGNPGTNVWSDLFSGRLTSRAAKSARGVMAVRPDGVAVIGTDQIEFVGIGVNPPVSVPLVFYYFPRYGSNTSCAQRLTEVDPFRAERARSYVAARQPTAPQSMVLIPGAEPGTDFGHFQRPAPVTPCTAPGGGTDGGTDGGRADAGMSPDGGGGGGGGGRPCGCGAAPGSVMLFAIALFALGTLRRRPRA